jgi:nucleoside-diphosphate-sugar epimerase
VYGVTKVSGELLCSYYYKKFGVDVRGLRYPGIISAEVCIISNVSIYLQALPGGGTTDYAVDIFYKAVEKGTYECYLQPNSVLPMMFMPDAIKVSKPIPKCY